MNEEAACLLGALQDLLDAYKAAVVSDHALIAALISRDLQAIRDAVTTHVDVLGTIEAAEKRRQAAEVAMTGTPDQATNCTALLAMLPPGDANRLRCLRGDLLHAMLHAQATGRQAAQLLRAAQAANQRIIKAVMPQASGYGPRGEQTVGRQPVVTTARWA